MDVSVGVVAHNEEKTIRALLLALLGQRLRKINIREILVVSSGSTDRTNEIVRDCAKKRGMIRLLEEHDRRGKAAAINALLKEAESDVVVLVSGDVVPEPDAIERLCSALSGDVGISTGRPVPRETGGLLGRVTGLQWRIHHEISLKRPKFGEMIAFRRVFENIGRTAVDEEYIGMLIKRRGLGSAYVPSAVVINTGPRSVMDFIGQRRRIYAGHLGLKRMKGHVPPTLSNINVVRGYLSLGRIEIAPALAGFVLETVSRTLGFCDFLSGREDVVWKMVKR
jgi:biofilm PGA synthesis N-glycosyltransferase PgaC